MYVLLSFLPRFSGPSSRLSFSTSLQLTFSLPLPPLCLFIILCCCSDTHTVLRRSWPSMACSTSMSPLLLFSTSSFLLSPFYFLFIHHLDTGMLSLQKSIIQIFFLNIGDPLALCMLMLQRLSCLWSLHKGLVHVMV